jgi:hypothetical protein
LDVDSVPVVGLAQLPRLATYTAWLGTYAIWGGLLVFIYVKTPLVGFVTSVDVRGMGVHCPKKVFVWAPPAADTLVS